MDIVQRYHKKQEYLLNLRDAAKSCLPELMDFIDDTQLQRIKTLIQSGEIPLSDFIGEHPSEVERNVIFYYNIAKPLIRTLSLIKEWHNPDIYVDCSIIDLFYRPEFCLDTTSIYNRLRLKGKATLTSLLTTIRNPEIRRLIDSAISEDRQQQFESILLEHGHECESFIKLIEIDAFRNSIVDIDSAPDDEKPLILKDYLSDLFPSGERIKGVWHLTDEELNQLEKYIKEVSASFVVNEAGSEEWLKSIHDQAVLIMATEISHMTESYTEEECDVLKRFINDPICPDFKQECLDAMPQLFGVTITDIDDDILAPPRYYYSWPTLKDFMQKEHLQAYCIRKLQPDVEKDFESEEGYEHFKRFMNQMAEYGGITNDVNMEALLQFVTGRRFDDAGKHLRWDGTLTNARILFYVVQKISADSTRTKFQYLKDDSFTIFSGIDGSEKKKLQGDKTEAKVTETIQGGKGFHDKAAELATYYPSLFRD